MPLFRRCCRLWRHELLLFAPGDRAAADDMLFAFERLFRFRLSPDCRPCSRHAIISLLYFAAVAAERSRDAYDDERGDVAA